MRILSDITVDARLVEKTRRRFDYFIPNYLQQYLRPSDRIVSVGCGLGYDVGLLRELGLDAWGLDPGSRTTAWKGYPSELAGRLRVGAAEDLPFGPEAFDFAYALEVIEHVGCEDGVWKLLPDATAIRRRFVESCLQMLRPGGRLLLSTSNRLCPIDVGHAHHYTAWTDWSARRLGLRLTVPWDRRNFVWSFRDVARCVASTRFGPGCHCEALSTSAYPSRSGGSRARGIARRLSHAMLGAVNAPPVRTSFLNPLLVVLITRQPDASGSAPAVVAPPD